MALYVMEYYFLLGPVSRKSRKLFGPEKLFVKLRPAYSLKLVFSYVVKGIKIKITAKFRATRRLRFEDTKRIDPIRILTVGLERACDGGSCGGNNLHLKRFSRISLSFMLVSSRTVRIRIWPIMSPEKFREF